MSSSTPSAPTTAPRDQMIRLGTTSMRVTTISVNWRSSPAAVCLGLKVLAKWPRPLPKLARNCAAATQFPTSLQISLRMATIAESRLKRTNWERSSKFARAKDISRGPYPRSVPTPRPWPAAQFWPRDSAGQKFWDPPANISRLDQHSRASQGLPLRPCVAAYGLTILSYAAATEIVLVAPVESGTSVCLTTLAGDPATTQRGGTSRVTTLLAPTIPPSPIVTPFKINAPNPIQAPLQIRTGCISSRSGAQPATLFSIRVGWPS